MESTAHTPTTLDPDDASQALAPRRRAVITTLRDDRGATTAEYAITTLAACGFAAILVIVLKSDPIRKLITGIITSALGMGG